MNDFLDITPAFTRPAPLLIFAIILSFALTALIYRRTNPIVNPLLRWTLLLLRWFSLVLLLLILFQTSLRFSRTVEEDPILIVAVDNSASMSLNERPDAVHRLMQQEWRNRDGESFDLRYYGISEDATELSGNGFEDLTFNGDATNLSTSLSTMVKNLAEQNLAGIVLISDGNYSEGGHPVNRAAELGVPIHTYVVGSPDPVPDLAIAGIRTQPFAYTNEENPVQVTLRNNGYSGRRVTLTLSGENEVLESRPVTLRGSPSENEIEFSFTPQREGVTAYQVSVAPGEGERVLGNNRTTFYINVLKSRVNVLLLAGSAKPEIAIARRVLAASDRYRLQWLVERGDGRYYGEGEGRVPANLNEIDLFIFIDFPTRTSSVELLGRLEERLAEDKSSLLILAGPRTRFERLPVLERLIPVRMRPAVTAPREAYAVLTPEGRSHPVTRLGPENIWPELPPVYINHLAESVSPEANVLANGRGEDGKEISPLLALKTHSLGKCALLLCDGLWRWDLLMAGIGREGEYFSVLFNSLARWSEIARTDDLVRARTDQTTYRFGQPVEIQIQVYDSERRPRDRARVDVEVIHEAGTRNTLAQSEGEGLHRLTLHPDRPGDYVVAVTATEEGRVLGETNVPFTVGEYSAELADPRSRPALMRDLAATSGGLSLDSESAPPLPGVSRSIVTVRDEELWNDKWLLFLLTASLTCEWILRKSRGMV